MLRKRRRIVLWIGYAVLPIASPVLSAFVLNRPEVFTKPYVYAIFSLLVFVSGAIAYVNVFKPLRDIEPLAQSFLDKLGEQLIALGKKDGIQPRLNILIVYRDWRSLFLEKYLQVVWSREMEYQPDLHASFPISKGVAGEVVRAKAPRLADIERFGHQGWGFDDKASSAFPKLTAIYSWPIYQLDRQQRPTAHILGTVNLDAQVSGAIRRIAANKVEYDALLRDFTRFASAIFSIT